MAYSFNGIGTTFYGQRDFRADGSYVTTEWIVFCCIPIAPLRSLRVKYQGPGDQGPRTHPQHRADEPRHSRGSDDGSERQRLVQLPGSRTGLTTTAAFGRLFIGRPSQ